MEDFDGAKASAEYSFFNVAPEMDGYRLTLSGFKDGGAGETKQGLTQVVEPDNVINSRLSNNPNNVIQILESIENIITS